ncbi:hypothetical protein Vadar_017916 [Vaccinium darrowii]|uniref:Uncharacterized protein n=1 Tax=Vaccinium darrowii TaxID=229202 RepID=A0ACB7XBJ6_9ERIC|nr:hypothetical protein Vadar_017916 [Vaccinium darrowii]
MSSEMGNYAALPLTWISLTLSLITLEFLSALTISFSVSSPDSSIFTGLRHVQQVWESLANRFNSLTKNNVQDLKCRLFSVTKTSTVEAYIDTIKDYAQKLAAAGHPLSEEDLIFHLLRGLPKVFNGFKTAVRTRGSNISFDDVVNPLNSEDHQLLQESSSDSDVTTVLVATHGNPNSTQHVPQNPQHLQSQNSGTSVQTQPQMNVQMPSSTQIAVTNDIPSATVLSAVKQEFQQRKK